MVDVAQLLQSLHPLREPPPPAPVAPYLVMLGLGCAVAAVALLGAWQTLRRRAQLRRSAQVALAASRALVPAERLAAQARLLRRLVGTLKGEAEARAEGQAWLETLDRAFSTRFFTEGGGRAFGEGLYRRAPEADVEAIDRSLAGFFAKLRPTKPRPTKLAPATAR